MPRIRVEGIATCKLVRYIYVSEKEAEEWEKMSKKELEVNMYIEDCNTVEIQEFENFTIGRLR